MTEIVRPVEVPALIPGTVTGPPSVALTIEEVARVSDIANIDTAPSVLIEITEGVLTNDTSSAQGEVQGADLRFGWNLVGWRSGTADVNDVVASLIGRFRVVFAWQPSPARFLSFSLSVPPFLNSLRTVRSGDGLWIHIDDPSGAVWIQGPDETDGQADLEPGFNLVTWEGADGVPVDQAVSSLGSALRALFVWDREIEEFLSYRPLVPSFLNTATHLRFGEGVWVEVSESINWDQRATAN